MLNYKPYSINYFYLSLSIVVFAVLINAVTVEVMCSGFHTKLAGDKGVAPLNEENRTPCKLLRAKDLGTMETPNPLATIAMIVNH